MASLLIVEIGTGVADANSYATAAQARTYAAMRGVALPAAPADGNDPVEQWLILAAQYLETKSFVGYRATQEGADGAQGLAWPRVFNYPLRGYPWIPFTEYWYDINWMTVDPSYYVLPSQIISAQCQLVVEQSNGIVLQPTTPGGIDGQFITRQKIDVIETSYSEKLGTLATPTMPAVDGWLKGLTVRGGGSSALLTVRA